MAQAASVNGGDLNERVNTVSRTDGLFYQSIEVHSVGNVRPLDGTLFRKLHLKEIGSALLSLSHKGRKLRIIRTGNWRLEDL